MCVPGVIISAMGTVSTRPSRVGMDRAQPHRALSEGEGENLNKNLTKF